MVIINCDDFGASSIINEVIYLAFENGLISSTTALVNFEGLEDAVSYVNRGLINPNSVGIHLNLTSGIPLTEEIKNNAIFCRDGSFIRNRSVLKSFFLDKHSRECVTRELESQIFRFREVFGFLPSHIDSHQHVHTNWAIAQCVIRLAKKHHIRSIRLSRNTSANIDKKKVYKWILNKYIGYNGLVVTDKFGVPNDFFQTGIDPSKHYEIMVHTKISENGEVLDQDSVVLRDKLNKVFRNKPWELVNYREYRDRLETDL
jgi:predicted glycoside hydrolase/deacetylase ChbG (UPF0249 family)